MMPPLPMAVGARDGLRRFLVGSGLRPLEESTREEAGKLSAAKARGAGLPAAVARRLREEWEWQGEVEIGGGGLKTNGEEAVRRLCEMGFFPVRDTHTHNSS